MPVTTKVHRAEIVMAIIVVALVANLTFTWQLRETPLFDHLAGKAYVLYLWAQRLASGELPVEQTYEGPPLPLWYLWGLFWLFGPNMGAVRLMGIISCATASVLTWSLGRIFGGEATGVLAALMLAGYGPMYYYEAILPGTALEICLILGALAASVVAVKQRQFLAWAASGGLVGLVSLARPNCHALIPALALWISTLETGERRRRFLAVFFLLLGWLAAQGLDSLVDLSLYGHVYQSPTWGIALYLGNGPEAGVGYGAAPFVRGSTTSGDVASFVAEASRRTGRLLNAAEASSFWARQAVDYVLAHPGLTARRLAAKTLHFFTPHEIPDNWDYDFWVERLPLLRGMLRFGHLLPLALVGAGAYLTRPRGPGALTVWLSVAYLTSTVVTLVLGRYRILIVPLFCVWAASGLVYLARLARGSRLQLAAACAVVVLSSAALTSVPAPYDRRVTQSNAWVDLGVLYEQEGSIADAMAAYQRALELNDQQFIAHIYLGDWFARASDYAGARSHYEQAAKTGCLLPAEMRRLAEICLQTGDAVSAGEWARRAAEAEQGFPER